ncbi:MAG TPA: hypothetical protein VGK93_00175, partial [Candidatus Eisenbacteria bacterium]
DRSVEDYAHRRAEQLKWWAAQNGQQPGDPARLARTLVAIALAERKVADLQAQIDAYRDLSTSLAFDELEPAGSAR